MAEGPPRPSAEEFGRSSPPEFETYTPNLFPEGSLGRQTFPSLLMGRTRPRSRMDIPIPFALKDQRRWTDPARTAETVRDLLSSSPKKLSRTERGEELLIKKTRAYLTGREEEWASSPDQNLLRAVFARKLGPVPAALEEDLRATVDLF